MIIEEGDIDSSTKAEKYKLSNDKLWIYYGSWTFIPFDRYKMYFFPKKEFFSTENFSSQSKKAHKIFKKSKTFIVSL